MVKQRPPSFRGRSCLPGRDGQWVGCSSRPSGAVKPVAAAIDGVTQDGGVLP